MRGTTRVAACAVVWMGCADEVQLDSVESAVDITQFQLPSMPAAERAPIIRAYDHLDPEDQVPRGLLEDAILYFDVNQAHIPNSDYLVVIDLSRFSGKDRFWLVDMASGAVEPHKVAHGSGSDPDHDGYANTFSNTPSSLMSSLGFSLTAEIYDGTHQHSMRLDGLSPDGSPNGMANTKMRERLVVVHEASYVDDSNTGKQGRSNGCPALDPDIEVSVVDRIHGGALMYIAKSSLAPAVGRAVCGDGVCDGAETAASCAMDCSAGPTDPGPADDPGADLDVDPDDPVAAQSNSCSTGGGAGLWLGLGALAALGVIRRPTRTRR